MSKLLLALFLIAISGGTPEFFRAAQAVDGRLDSSDGRRSPYSRDRIVERAVPNSLSLVPAIGPILESGLALHE